jgi:hypothetical protein
MLPLLFLIGLIFGFSIGHDQASVRGINLMRIPRKPLETLEKVLNQC